MTIVALTALCVIVILLYHAQILRERIDLLTTANDRAVWRYTRERQRANTLRMCIAKHEAAKGALMAEMVALEVRNCWLEQRRCLLLRRWWRRRRCRHLAVWRIGHNARKG